MFKWRLSASLLMAFNSLGYGSESNQDLKSKVEELSSKYPEPTCQNLLGTLSQIPSAQTLGVQTQTYYYCFGQPSPQGAQLNRVLENMFPEPPKLSDNLNSPNSINTQTIIIEDNADKLFGSEADPKKFWINFFSNDLNSL